MKVITSRQNPLVAEYRRLARSRPPEAGDVLLDGVHLVAEAHAAGVRIRTAAVTRAAAARAEVADLMARLQQQGAAVVGVSDDVLAAISPTRTPSGLVALAVVARQPLAAALLRPPHLVFLLADVQDPGNVGAVVRSAEAAGASGVVCCGATADPFSWKALRGSMGGAFRLPVVGRAAIEEVVASARLAGLAVTATARAGGQNLFDLDLTPPMLCLLGSEGAGLPAEILAHADRVATIPLTPPVESLNVSTAAAVVAFEAYRQRLLRRGPLPDA